MVTPKRRKTEGKPPMTLPSRAEFLVHVALFVALTLVVLAFSLGLGVLGYHRIVGLGWIDSLLNASMILTGMGPVDTMPDDASKVFASLYAMFGGAIYPILTAVVLYPFVHRMLKALHLEAVANATGQDDDEG